MGGRVKRTREVAGLPSDALVYLDEEPLIDDEVHTDDEPLTDDETTINDEIKVLNSSGGIELHVGDDKFKIGDLVGYSFFDLTNLKILFLNFKLEL